MNGPGFLTCFPMTSPETGLSTDWHSLAEGAARQWDPVPSQPEGCQSVLCSTDSLWVQGCSWVSRSTSGMGRGLSAIPIKYTAGHISSHQLHCANLQVEDSKRGQLCCSSGR